MLPASRAGSLLPGSGGAVPGAGPAGPAAPATAPAIAAIQKGQGLALDKFPQDGVLTLGVRPVEPGEPPFLWADADYAAGGAVPFLREGLLPDVEVDNRPVLVPLDDAIPLYWDFEERRFSGTPVPGGRCGTISTDWLHPLAAIPAFDENADRDLTAAADYAAIRNRRVNTDGERTGAARVTLPPSISVTFGDVVTFFSPPATAARRFDIHIAGGAVGIRTEARDFVAQIGFNPSARYEYITLRADGAFWAVDHTASVHNVLRVSALRLAYQDVATRIRPRRDAEDQRVATEAAVRRALEPDILYDGFGEGVDALTITADSSAWVATERVHFRRGLSSADDGRMLIVAGDYTVGNSLKHFSFWVPAWLFRHMRAIDGTIATADHTLTLVIQRPAAGAAPLEGWAEALLHLARWRADNRDGVWFNAGYRSQNPNISNFRCRVQLR